MVSGFKLFIKRFLIFQFAYLFIFSKLTKIDKSILDFSKRLKYFAKNIPLSSEKIVLIESKSETIFITLFSIYSLMVFLALMNIGIGKQITGMITMFMALIYCNPLITIKKNLEKNNYQFNWKIYIPSIEFCIISILGFAMMLSSFYFFEDDDKDIKTKQVVKEEEKNIIRIEKAKIN